MDMLGVLREPLPPAPNEETERFLQRGMKMYAIKSYREQTGVDLRTASFAVDFVEAEMKTRGLI